ncbi:MAG: hypothetical protein KDI19_02980 [Pseudomonadales bacterium]|nr:hypothetical protein [Pseudomonadales bacterium]
MDSSADTRLLRSNVLIGQYGQDPGLASRLSFQVPANVGARSAGVLAKDVETGIEVVATTPGTWAERVGLAPEYLLVTLNDAPIFNQHEFAGMLRVLPPGASLAAK